MEAVSARKKIRLEGFDYSNPGCYFITICVRNKHELLGQIVGADAHIGPPRPMPTSARQRSN
jgi:hypothetical protein